MTRYPKLLAYAQLLRLPNVFTAFADILMASCVTGAIASPFPNVALLLLASGSFYLSGMVWNDIFDREEDNRLRPFRPIPSGRVKLKSAIVLATILSVFGVATAAHISYWYHTYTILIAFILMLMIIAYDGWLKSTRIGPLAMGSCRLLNVLLGLSISTDSLTSLLGWQVAGIVGLYVVGVTWFARTEEVSSARRSLLGASLVMSLAGIAVLLVPLHRPSAEIWWGVPYALFVSALVVGKSVWIAVSDPQPMTVQYAVKSAIFGLVFLDAVIASIFVGPTGLLIGLLLIPAIILGKRIYST